MAATFAWAESNGSTETITEATNLNFGSVDAANQTDYANSIRVGEHSFEKYVRGKWTSDGTTTTISNCKLWKSAGTLPTGVSIVGAASATYAAPVGGTTASTKATAAIGTDFAGGLELVNSTGISLGVSGNVVYSTNYGVMQLKTDGTASPGKVPASGSITFTIQYDEA